jgi:proteasome lid subunit RPN8/RPN11
MVLELNSEHLQTIQAHAEKTYPNECCGLFLGNRVPEAKELTKVLVEVRPTDNTWSSQSTEFMPVNSRLTATRRYWIAPETLLANQRYARHHDLEIIGIYHSHPDHPAVPSQTDRDWAWPEYSYVIVSVQQGASQDLRSWMLDSKGDFQSEKIVILNFAKPEVIC